jgi:hypothetical protein
MAKWSISQPEVQSQVEADSPHLRCCHCDLVRLSERYRRWYQAQNIEGLGNHDWR